jgi:hypothetical protein
LHFQLPLKLFRPRFFQALLDLSTTLASKNGCYSNAVAGFRSHHPAHLLTSRCAVEMQTRAVAAKVSLTGLNSFERFQSGVGTSALTVRYPKEASLELGSD